MEKILRFEITDKCNQRCSMCWSTEWEHHDMKWEQIEKMIIDYSMLFPNGTVVLTSREPLLSPHLKKVLQLTQKLNLTVKILTNGTLLTDDICDLITKSSVDFVGISIHGTSEFHDNIVAIKGAFSRTLKGLKKLQYYKEKNNKEDLEVRITTTVNKNLYDSLDEIITLAKENKAFLRIQHMMWHPSLIKDKHKKYIKEKFRFNDDVIDDFSSHVDVSPEDVLKILSKTKKMCDLNNVDLQIYPNMTDEQVVDWYSEQCEETYENKYCDHVEESIRVRANGDISLCQYIEMIYGNVGEIPLSKILENEKYKKIAKELKCGKMFPICLHCCHMRIKDKKEVLNNKSI